jgi:hypothetical protein
LQLMDLIIGLTERDLSVNRMLLILVILILRGENVRSLNLSNLSVLFIKDHICVILYLIDTIK